MRALVCGGRDCSAADAWNWLERFGHQDAADAIGCSAIAGSKISVLIHGGARGADEGAARWGESEGIKVLAFPADWKKHGKAGFAGGRGTADMLRQTKGAGIPIVRAG